MNKFLLALPLLFATSCGTIQTMNDNLYWSTQGICDNTDAVQRNTMTIQQNAQLVDASTRAIEANKRALEAVEG